MSLSVENIQNLCYYSPNAEQTEAETTGSVASAPGSLLFDFAAEKNQCPVETTGSVASLFTNNAKTSKAASNVQPLFASNTQSTETTGVVASSGPSSGGSGSFSMAA